MKHNYSNIFGVDYISPQKNFENVVIPKETTMVICKFKGLKTLDGIENFPSSVVELDVSFNFIDNIKGIEKTNITILNLDHNNMESMNDLIYSKIEQLKLRGNPCSSDFEECGNDINKLREKHDSLDVKYCDM